MVIITVYICKNYPVHFLYLSYNSIKKFKDWFWTACKWNCTTCVLLYLAQQYVWEIHPCSWICCSSFILIASSVKLYEYATVYLSILLLTVSNLRLIWIIFLYMSFGICMYTFLQGIYLEVKLLDLRVCVYSAGYTGSFTTWSFQFTALPSMYKDSH